MVAVLGSSAGTTGSAAVSGVDRSVAVAPDADDVGETVCGAVVGRSDSGAVDPGAVVPGAVGAGGVAVRAREVSGVAV